jgi:hypothetical protein
MSTGCGTLAKSFNLPTNKCASGQQKMVEYWNPDSMISNWTDTEIRRDAAGGAHDVHRHDAIKQHTLPGSDRVSISGVMTADACFLEPWGFSLGSRDRQGNPVGWFKPTTQGENFRTTESYQMPTNPKSTINFQSNYRPGTDLQKGELFGTKSCRGWDRWNHTAYREAAKMSNGIHRNSERKHKYPGTNCEIRPASIYTLNFKKNGEAVMQDHIPKTVKHGAPSKWRFGSPDLLATS